MAVTYRLQTGQSAADAILSPAYGDLYDEIHADPSYNANPLFARKRFIERTISQVQQPGFELVTAQDGTALAGFSFGFTMVAGRWWGGETSPPPAKVVDVPKIAVIELMVGEPYRGSGVGKQMLGELLTDRAEPYATLLARPEAPAHAMYERWGWDVVGTCRPAPDGPLMDVMLLEIQSGTQK